MVKYFFITTVNLFFIVAGANLMGFRVNTTKSYPEGIYRQVSDAWSKADLVEACLPSNVRDYAIERGYLKTNGRCDGHPPVIKTVFGLGGDSVVLDTSVSINGERVPNTAIINNDGTGKNLTATSDVVIDEESVWLMSVHSDQSFDSRYFGPIDRKYVIGKLVPVWTF